MYLPFIGRGLSESIHCLHRTFTFDLSQPVWLVVTSFPGSRLPIASVWGVDCYRSYILLKEDCIDTDKYRVPTNVSLSSELCASVSLPHRGLCHGGMWQDLACIGIAREIADHVAKPVNLPMYIYSTYTHTHTHIHTEAPLCSDTVHSPLREV